MKSILGLVATVLGVLLILEIIEHLSHRLVWPVLVPGYVRGNCKSRIYHRAGRLRVWRHDLACSLFPITQKCVG